MEFHVLCKVFITTVLVGFMGLCFGFYDEFVAKPKKLRSIMMKQGIGGPPPTLVIGNIMDAKRSMDAMSKSRLPGPGVPTHHDTSTPLFPFLQHWRKQYGDVFMFNLGNSTILLVTELEMVREMRRLRSLDMGKPSHKVVEMQQLFGSTSNGLHWARQRKILAPPFFMDKVQGMIKLIQQSANDLSNCWNNLIEANGGIADIKIDEHLRRFSGDVILKTSLGSNYTKGVDLFSKIAALQLGASKKLLVGQIPGFKYMHSKTKREACEVAKQIKNLILELVKERKNRARHEDLLQIIMDGAKSIGVSKQGHDEFIVDNFKVMFLAAYDTTSTSATWCLMLLGAYPEWQQRVRAEVLQVCQGQFPDAAMLLKMKQLDMVITETLRLYSPAPAIQREVLKEMKIGNLTIPKGINIWVYVQALHTDPKIWGTDSLEFKPERFANGVSGASKYPYCYMPFGLGSRLCIGQNLAMMEIKMIIALILSRFSFTLFPSYNHSPSLQLLVKPEHGVNLCIKKLN